MSLDFSDLTWRCDICRKERPDARISVWKVDLTPPGHLPPWTVTRNVKYCNDNMTCRRGAENWKEKAA